MDPKKENVRLKYKREQWRIKSIHICVVGEKYIVQGFRRIDESSGIIVKKPIVQHMK
jgi:hypothetical protein